MQKSCYCIWILLSAILLVHVPVRAVNNATELQPRSLVNTTFNPTPSNNGMPEFDIVLTSVVIILFMTFLVFGGNFIHAQYTKAQKIKRAKARGTISVKDVDKISLAESRMSFKKPRQSIGPDEETQQSPTPVKPLPPEPPIIKVHPSQDSPTPPPSPPKSKTRGKSSQRSSPKVTLKPTPSQGTQVGDVRATRRDTSLPTKTTLKSTPSQETQVVDAGAPRRITSKEAKEILSPSRSKGGKKGKPGLPKVHNNKVRPVESNSEYHQL